jgi:DNA-binding LytR/AlgR family response regulator
METLKIMIVDDEPLAREILEDFVAKAPGCELTAICKNALEAFIALSRQPVDLILLDIDMPDMSGLDLLRTLRQPPPAIFTTAYSQFALESYEHNAVDYLLKPIAFSRFLKAIDKAKSLLHSPGSSTSLANAAAQLPSNELFVKADGKLVKVSLDKLMFVEGLRDYLKLWSETGSLVIYGTMKQMENELSHRGLFMRINKSYIVNLAFVRELDGNLVRIKDYELPVGHTYAVAVHETFGRMKLL